MKKRVYNLIKFWIKTGLYLYYGRIKVSGLGNIPKDGPVVFLPNHQNALLDPLLIAVDCVRKPYFLTRSDVFKGKLISKVFDFFQMIPIYRIRDGRESLKNNQAVFDRCVNLLKENQAILLFPEASHNLIRKVRPLSKGFTRIIFNAFDSAPDLDIHIVPVGINYRDAIHFPDRVALFFGQPISVKDYYDPSDIRTSIDGLKSKVSGELKIRTTHIEDETSYDDKIAQLNALGVDYLNPKEVNLILKKMDASEMHIPVKKKSNIRSKIFKGIFILCNLPIVLLWRALVKPKVSEPEFMSTIRFGFAFLVYPIYYLILVVVLSFFFKPLLVFGLVSGLFLFNILYVRSE